MITKKQWAAFCFHVQQAKGKNLEPFIHGQSVIEVDTYDNEIVTSLQGQPRTRYSYTEENYKDRKLTQLYRSVKLTNVVLSDLSRVI